MHQQRFDDLTRTLATGLSRRFALKALVANAIGVLALGRRALGGSAAPGAEAVCRPPGRPCDRARQCCTQICKRGRCRCEDGRKPCDGVCCVDVVCCAGVCCADLEGCRDGRCVDHCEDGERDGDETDVDCGGERCPKCEALHKCIFDTDCLTGHCDENFRCSECSEDSHCTTAPFDVCVNHECRQCRDDAECPPGRLCTGNQCIRHCGNGVLDGDETDKDCGGSCTEKCGINRGCRSDGDCRSGICLDSRCRECRDKADCQEASFPFCVNTTCVACEDDGDCQGTLPVCVDNSCRQCRQDSHCPTGKVCIGNQCRSRSHCANGVKDGNETDVDCGGGVCPRCAPEKLCVEDSDCQIFHDGVGHCGSYDLGDGSGSQRRCAECFRDVHCPADHICSVPRCTD